MDISWYKGNERINTFTISVSNDGNSFTNIYSTKSNGKTITETYDLQDVVARFLRITVNGNTQNNWVTIGDINVKGSAPGPTDCADLPISDPAILQVEVKHFFLRQMR